MFKKLMKLLCVLAVAFAMTACAKEDSGIVEIEIVQYKPEAAAYFKKVEEAFNSTHTDIKLTINSPNDATTVMKTRFTRENYPDIIGIGGDVNYSMFVDAKLLADISDFDGLKNVKQAYLDILDSLEYVPTEGMFGVPYVANAAGILFNKEMFDKNGWKVPTNWSEFIKLCDTIKASGTTPLYFGFKDTWTTLAPWNALAIELTPSDICNQVNAGQTTFTESYPEVAEKIKKMLDYCEPGPFAYGYNDACTAFARGHSAMFAIGSYAVPQILSVNPDLKIDSFVMPGHDDSSKQVLNSGVDLMFSVMETCKHKKEAYEVLNFLMEHDNVQQYIDDQNAVPCLEGEYKLASMLNSMKSYIDEGKMLDFQDHHYPSEMAVDAQIQTYLINGDKEKFLNKFDKDWVRYNRDIIQKVKDYYANQGQ